MRLSFSGLTALVTVLGLGLASLATPAVALAQQDSGYEVPLGVPDNTQRDLCFVERKTEAFGGTLTNVSYFVFRKDVRGMADGRAFALAVSTQRWMLDVQKIRECTKPHETK